MVWSCLARRYLHMHCTLHTQTLHALIQVEYVIVRVRLPEVSRLRAIKDVVLERKSPRLDEVWCTLMGDVC